MWPNVIFSIIFLMTFVTPVWSTLVLSVGDVDHTSARILYDEPRFKGQAQKIQIYYQQASEAKVFGLSLQCHYVKSVSIEFREYPQVVQIHGLMSLTHYYVVFAPDEYVEFVTFPELRQDFPQEFVRFVIVSCDRYREKDPGIDEFWGFLYQQERHHYVAMIHLGDQIYADDKQSASYVSPMPLRTYEEYLEEFRNGYRLSWGRPSLQQILRFGAHLMIPDDHEILNNFERWHRDLFPDYMKAGLRAFYEFEFQLTQNIPPNNEMPQSFGFARRYQSLGFIFVDTRYQRVFGKQETTPSLFGSGQLEQVQQQLEVWDKDVTLQHAVIFSSVPLYFHGKWTSIVAEVVEQDYYPGHVRHVESMKKFGDILLSPAGTKVHLLAAGDVHLLATGQVCESTSGHCFQEMITSGMTKPSTSINDIKLTLYHLLVSRWTYGPAVPNWWVDFQYVNLRTNYGYLQLHSDGRLDHGFRTRDCRSTYECFIDVICHASIGWYTKLICLGSLILVIYHIMSLLILYFKK